MLLLACCLVLALATASIPTCDDSFKLGGWWWLSTGLLGKLTYKIGGSGGKVHCGQSRDSDLSCGTTKGHDYDYLKVKTSKRTN